MRRLQRWLLAGLTSRGSLLSTTVQSLTPGANERMTLDLGSLRFFKGTEQEEQEEPRVEFHFPKQVEGRSTLDPDSERIVFHCKASAKTPRLGHGNTLALRAEFHPRAMRFHGVPDL